MRFLPTTGIRTSEHGDLSTNRVSAGVSQPTHSIRLCPVTMRAESRPNGNAPATRHAERHILFFLSRRFLICNTLLHSLFKKWFVRWETKLSLYFRSDYS